MNNTFTQKNIVKKVLIALIFILLFNFIVPYYNNVSYCDDEYDYEESTKNNKKSAGGKLLAPIKAFLLFIGDSVLEILQNSFVSQNPVVIPVAAREYSSLNGWLIAGLTIGSIVVLGALCVTGIGVAVAGTAISGAAAAGGGALTVIVAGSSALASSGALSMIGGGVVALGLSSVAVYSTGKTAINELKGNFELPFIIYTPGRIFSNSIPLFDINFINPMVEKIEQQKVNVNALENSNLVKNVKVSPLGTESSLGKTKDEIIAQYKTQYGYTDEKLLTSDTNENLYSHLMEFLLFSGGVQESIKENIFWTNNNKIYGIRVIQVTTTVPIYADAYQEVQIGTEQKIYDRFEFIEADIEEGAITEDKELIIATYESSAQILQTTVASWYKTLRTLAIVALLTILVYVGIRIVLSSTAKDKAKYKQMIMDWIVALCLLFVMHYIMTFILYISEQLTEICKESDIENVAIEIPANTKYKGESGDEWIFDATLRAEDEKSEETAFWGTNFIGMTRFEAGLPTGNRAYKSFGFTVIYLVLVLYTCVFTFMYLKRVLWMAFLTMIAPLVAITYPIDKVNDGKAQAFNLWLKEYIFNALMQPIHYLIYTIIIGSAMVLIVDHPVYALVALGFMMPAEKFIKKMFGFEKASTPAALGGAAAAGLMMNSIQRLTGKAPHGDKDDEDDEKPKTTKTKISKNSNPFGFIDNGEKGGEKETSLPKPKGKPSAIPTVKGANRRPVKESNNTQQLGRRAGSRINDSRIALGSNAEKNKTNNSRRVPGINRISNNSTNWGSDSGRTTRQSRRNSRNASKYSFARREQRPKNIATDNANKKEKRVIKTKAITNSKPVIDNNTSNVNIANTPEVNNKKRNIKSNITTGLLAAGSYYRDRAAKRGKKFRPLRAMRRGASFMFGAIAGGALAAAATIVDPSKAEQYLTAGIYGGGKFAQGLSDKAAGAVNIRGGTKAFTQGYLGEKYADIDDAIYKTNYGLNHDNFMKALQKLGPDKAKELFKQGGVAHQCIDQKIYDIGDVIDVYKGKEDILKHGLLNGYKGSDKEKLAETASIQAFKDKARFGDIENDTKKLKNFRKVVGEDIERENPGISKRDKEEQLRRREDAIRLINGNKPQYKYGENGIIEENGEERKGTNKTYKSMEFLRQKELPDTVINAGEEAIVVYKPQEKEMQKIEQENAGKQGKLKEEYGGKELDETVVKRYQEKGIYDLEQMYKIDSAKDEFLKYMKNTGLSTEETEQKARDMAIASYRLNDRFGDLTNEENYKKFKKFSKEQGYTPEEEQNLARTMTFYNGYTDRNIDTAKLDEQLQQKEEAAIVQAEAEKHSYDERKNAEDNLRDLRSERDKYSDEEESAKYSIEEAQKRIDHATTEKEREAATKEKEQYEKMAKNASKLKEEQEEKIKEAQIEAKKRKAEHEAEKKKSEKLSKERELLEIKKKAKKSRDSYEASKERQRKIQEKNKEKQGDSKDVEVKGAKKTKRTTIRENVNPLGSKQKERPTKSTDGKAASKIKTKDGQVLKNGKGNAGKGSAKGKSSRGNSGKK